MRTDTAMHQLKELVERKVAEIKAAAQQADSLEEFDAQFNILWGEVSGIAQAAKALGLKEPWRVFGDRRRIYTMSSVYNWCSDKVEANTKPKDTEQTLGEALELVTEAKAMTDELGNTFLNGVMRDAERNLSESLSDELWDKERAKRGELWS